MPFSLLQSVITQSDGGIYADYAGVLIFVGQVVSAHAREDSGGGKKAPSNEKSDFDGVGAGAFDGPSAKRKMPSPGGKAEGADSPPHL